MNRTGIRHGIAGALPLAVVILSLTFGITVDAHTAYGSAVAATGAPASVKGGAGGSAPWGFLLAIFAAITIFIIAGVFIVLRSRREYLDEQARKAAMPRDDGET
jgi:Na+/melibiose symporter-like transporter